MRKWFILVAFAMVLASLAIVASCGETDPAQAPAGSGISFVTESGEGDAVTVTLEYSVDDTFGFVSACFEPFRDNMIALCKAEAYFLNHPNADQAEADTACEQGTVWPNYVDTPLQNNAGSAITYGMVAGDFDIGDCGYYEQILVAIVTRSSGSSASTDVIAGVPLNGVEVRWVTQGEFLELYELADVPGDIPPLANPYLDETDDRGVTELKTRFPIPIAAGVSGDYIVTVDIGVDLASYKFTVTTEEADTGGATGDDDTTE